MEYTTKILIADENSSSRSVVKDCFLRAGCRYIEEAVNGEDALARISRQHPDIVIIDIWMSKVDGLSVVRSAKTMSYGNDKPPVIIMTSPISNQNIFVQALQAGADLCLIKPINQSNLIEYAESMLKNRNSKANEQTLPSHGAETDNTPDIEAQVTRIIHQIGVPAHIKGYQYLRTAILLTVKDSDIINSVTKVLYPDVARCFDCQKGNVERSIRTAMDSAWKQGDPQLWSRYFPNALHRPSNAVFISRIAEALLLEE